MVFFVLMSMYGPFGSDPVFNAENLLPPSSETVERLHGSFDNLASFAVAQVLTGVYVELTTPSELEQVRVECGRHITYATPDLNGANSTINRLIFDAVLGDRSVRFGTGLPELGSEDAAHLESVVEKITRGLTPTSASWLKDTHQEALHIGEQSDVFTPMVIDRVMEQYPAGVANSSLYNIDGLFNNGTRIQGYWMVGNEAFHESQTPTTIFYQVHLKDARGSVYSFIEKGNGDIELLITRPGERIPTPTDPETLGQFGINVILSDDDDKYMDNVLKDVIEHAIAEANGANKPTEGSVLDLTQAINSATNSGLAA